MLTPKKRYALLGSLILVAGLASLALRGEDSPLPALPQAERLLAGSSWQPVGATRPAGYRMVYRQWLLREGSGQEALLYLGATARVQTMLEWSGELGYEGEGYVVTDRHRVSVPLPTGRQAPVMEAYLWHLDDRRLVRSAVVGPQGIAAEGRDLAPGSAWDLIVDHKATYYMVRVSAQAPATGTDQIMARILDRLRAAARAS